MPFVPSSPVRLYATRKSRFSSATDASPTTTASKNSGMKKLRDSFPSITLRTATDPSSSIFASGEGDQQSPSEPILAAEAIAMDEQFLRRDLEDAERTLSIEEALATGALINDAAARESSSARIRSQSTLFDNISESEYSIEEDVRPIVGRASSVRVSKPLIVENRPTKTSKSQVKQTGHSRSNSRFSLKAERVVSGSGTEMLPTMPEDSSQQYSGQTIRSVTSEDSDDASPRILSQSFETTSSPLPAPASMNDTYGELTPTLAAYESALPTGSTLHSVYPRIVQPEGSLIESINDTSVSPIQRPERTMSVSLPSPGQGLSRRVQIRPADLITKKHHEHSSFRETVVTTPYPPRLSDDITSMDFDGIERKGSDEEPARKNNQRERQRQRISLTSITREKDRFPSPERPEILFLDLNLHNHPEARVTLEIEIADRTTFDDEALFQQIKAVYQTQLLNKPRRIFSLVRKTVYVTTTGCTQSPHRYHSLFNSAEFLQHIHNPQLGRRRKIWVLWLRNQNTSQTANTPRIRHIDNLTRLSTRARSAPHSRHSSQGTKSFHTDKDEHKRLSTASDASSFYFAYSPMLPKLPFLSSRHDNSILQSAPFDLNNKSPVRSFFHPSSPPPAADRGESPPRLTLSIHHSFRLTTITLLTLLNFLSAVLCAAIWTLFGVPGTHPGSDTQQEIPVGRGHVTVATDWHIESQGRILTGVIIGLVVLVMGSLGEGLLLWMGWLLL